MTITTYDHHPTLRHEERDAVGAALQAALVDLTDLALAGKQLHWNVTGRSFRSLHLQLDELVELARDASDDVAERARALGWSPDGRRGTIAAGSSLPEVQEGILTDTQTVGLTVDALTATIATVRAAMDHAAEYDAVSEDLLHQIAQDLEKQAWMFSAVAGH